MPGGWINVAGIFRSPKTSSSQETLPAVVPARSANVGMVMGLIHQLAIYKYKKQTRLDASTAPNPMVNELTRERPSMEALERRALMEARGRHCDDVELINAMLECTTCLRARSGEEVDSRFSQHIDSCAVCLENLGSNSMFRQLPCEHVFHQGCIDTWFQKHVTCPVCNTSIVESCSETARVEASELIRKNTECRQKALMKKSNTGSSNPRCDHTSNNLSSRRITMI